MSESPDLIRAMEAAERWRQAPDSPLSHYQRWVLAMSDKILQLCEKVNCPKFVNMGEHACLDRTQCWEPCGDLGRDGNYIALPRDQATGAETVSTGAGEKHAD